MKNKGEKIKPFDLACLILFVLLLILSFYFFYSSWILLAVLVLVLSAWSLMTFLGSTLFAPAYLEGHIVRLLIKGGGRMPQDEISNYYSKYGSLDFVISRLKKRCVIETKDGDIKLIEDNMDKGFKNRLMLWATRKVKL